MFWGACPWDGGKTDTHRDIPPPLSISTDDWWVTVEPTVPPDTHRPGGVRSDCSKPQQELGLKIRNDSIDKLAQLKREAAGGSRR